MSDSLWPHGLYSPWNSLGQNTGVGSLPLLQGIFLTQGLKPRSPALQSDSLPAEPQGKPTVAVPIYISPNLLFPAFIVCRFFDDGLLFYVFECGRVQKFQMYKRLKILQWTRRYPLPVSCDWRFACMYLSHFSPSLEGKVSIMDFISFTVLVPFRFSILSVKFCFSNNWYISKFISVLQLIGIKLLIISFLHSLQDLQWCLVFIPDNGDFSGFINFISLFKEHITLMIILYCMFH